MFRLRNKEDIIGTLDYVSFPDLGLPSVLAKVDTGAFSGALHCTDIKLIKSDSSGKKILSFKPLGKSKYKIETSHYQSRYVRSSNGHRVRRYIIQTNLKWNGKIYPITIGLTDRESMRREVLIGRHFLQEHNIKVDTRINQELDDERELIR